RTRAQEEPDVCAFAFLAAESTETRLTYGQLYRRARAAAALLQRAGAAGERVLIVLEPGSEYVIAIFACLLAGCTMVPCAPSRRTERSAQWRAIATDSGARFAIGCPPGGDADIPQLQWLTLDIEEPDAWREPDRDPDSIALLQYTSGSTALPRGVMVSHANL